jgi:hypothetical protein
LTEKGRELESVCDALGQWGARWLEIQPHHLDPAYVLWQPPNGRLVLDGPRSLARAYPTWIRPSPFAAATPGTAAASPRAATSVLTE